MADIDEVTEPDDPEVQEAIHRYMRAFEAADVAALVGLLTRDAVLEMPPVPLWYRGSRYYGRFMRRIFDMRGSRWQMRQLSANGQPALAAYASEPGGCYVPHTLQVFTVTGGRIARNVVFADRGVFPLFGLPETTSVGDLRRSRWVRTVSPVHTGETSITSKRTVIMSVIVIEFMTLDGRVTDPDGRGGTPTGGWAFRHGPQTIAGDKFRLGQIMDDGVMLLGRRTWQLFSQMWPERDDPFSARMNAIPKLVASRTLTDVSAWSNSQILGGDPVATVKSEHRDVIITGSLPIVQSLMAHDLVDEYRLLIFPTVLGAGDQLFPANRPPVYLECRSAEPVGAAILARYGKSAQ